MTANKWYCIAQTTTFDTGCGINVAFEDSSILFTANVRYGTSSINISSCSIQDEYEVSVRLRETSTMWCVDLLCNKDIEPQIDVTDSPYWSSSNVAAGTGTILTVINNISKAFNTNKGTGEGESYWDRINVGTEENPIYSVVPKNYNDQVVHIVSYGEVSSGGFSQSEEGEGGGSIVIVEQIVTSTDGTPVANILINGEDNFIYAPNTTKALDAHIEDYNTYKTLTDETLRRHDERLVALEELNNLGLSLVEQDGKTWLRSEYDFFSEGEVSSGGASDTEGEGGSGGSVVTVEQIVTDANGVPIAKINVDGVPNVIYAPRTAEVDLTGYATTDYVDNAIQNAKDTRVDTLINTTIPALESDLTALRNDFDALNTLLNDDVSEKIDTWNEVVDFLDEYSGSQDLATILSVMNADIAKRALQSSLDTTNANLNNHIDTFNTFVDATNNTLLSHNDRIKTFEDMFEWDGESIKAKASFYSVGEVSSGGLSDTGGSTGGNTVSWDGAYESGNLLGTLYIDGVANTILGPLTLPNPYALTINGEVYDGSKAVDITISGGVSGDYLPITGGVVSGTIYTTATPGIILKRGEGKNPYLRFTNLEDVNYGEVGVTQDGSFAFWPAVSGAQGYGQWNTVLHTGNTTEEIVEGVTVPFAGTLKSVSDFTNSFTTRRSFIGSVYLGGNTLKWYNVISVRHRNGVSDGTGHGMYIATKLTETQDLFWNKQTGPGVWQGERTIIDSANIGSQSVNYANSAGKLANKRTLWGQPFDGTGDISINTAAWMPLTFYMNAEETESFGYVGRGTNVNDLRVWNYYNNRLLFGTNNIERIRIEANGNVLIGATTDNGEERLQVPGSFIYCQGLHSSQGGYIWWNNDGIHLNPTAGDTYNALNILNNGNVLIGTPSDNGYKLQVTGSVRASQNVRAEEDMLAKQFYVMASGSYGGANNSIYARIGGYDHVGGVVIQFGTQSKGIDIINNAWSKSLFSFSQSGHFVASGEVTSGSDARYKRIESYAEIDINTIANAPIINFRWTDREDDKLHLGSTAQYWYNTSLLNGVSPTDDEKLWTMGYGQIALASVVSIAKKVVNHEERLQIVERELADYKAENQILKQQLNQYRYGIQ